MALTALLKYSELPKREQPRAKLLLINSGYDEEQLDKAIFGLVYEKGKFVVTDIATILK